MSRLVNDLTRTNQGLKQRTQELASIARMRAIGAKPMGEVMGIRTGRRQVGGGGGGQSKSRSSSVKANKMVSEDE